MPQVARIDKADYVYEENKLIVPVPINFCSSIKETKSC